MAHAAAPLDGGNSDRLRAFGSLFDLESDALIFLQGTKSAPANRGVVDKHICPATVGRDKAKALVAVEPFDGSLCHIPYFLILPTSCRAFVARRCLCRYPSGVAAARTALP